MKKRNWKNFDLYLTEIITEEQIRKNADKVEWSYVSALVVLSEDFIREFKDRVNWQFICASQDLSEDFIREFKDRVDWQTLVTKRKWTGVSFSQTFQNEFSDLIDFREIYELKLGF